MKQQFASLLSQVGFVDTPDAVQPERCPVMNANLIISVFVMFQADAEANVRSDDESLIKAVLCAALYPRVIK
jgi:hypothetical protein